MIASVFGNPLYLYGIEPTEVDAAAAVPMEAEASPVDGKVVEDLPDIAPTNVQPDATQLNQRVKLAVESTSVSPLPESSTIVTTNSPIVQSSSVIPGD